MNYLVFEARHVTRLAAADLPGAIRRSRGPAQRPLRQADTQLPPQKIEQKIYDPTRI